MKSLNEQIAGLKNIPGSIVPNGDFLTPSGIKYNWESWMSDAWELFEELPRNSKIVSYGKAIENCWGVFYNLNNPEFIEVFGKTAPEAICKAYLAWKESK